ncbi:hypothetical protein CEXT_652091 [Caerostris extrusa]|uniref:Uncharacterized protein n=1 Tax=Caerostris extrusa TaxID=172846 RepID=A0AAV4SBX5_CAEEX|nr:hypothetical protein CEXT_652091 [Caerostris extrusa]
MKDDKINLIQSNNDTIVSWEKQDEKNQFSKVNSEIFHEKTDLSDVDVFNEKSKTTHQYNMDKSEMKSIDVAGEGQINSRNIHDSPTKTLSCEEEIVCSDEENTTGNTDLSTEENSGCKF